MSQVSKRKWVIRAAFWSFLVLAALGCWAGTNVSLIKVRYAAYQLRNASTDEERVRAGNQLVSLGTPGLIKLMDVIQSGDDSCRSAARDALNRHLADMPDGDRRAVLVAGQILDAFSKSAEAGRTAILDLMPNILKRTGNTYALKCRDAIAAGLKSSNIDTRILAIRLALHPDLKMRGELLSLLNDLEPRIRGAALFGVATASDTEQLLGDEELFRWLHDPDEGVRKVCYNVLVSRDRSETEISLARRLSDPDPRERLKLLYDLRYEEDVVDPEPWLERLSRDREPALRAGATRVFIEVMMERKLSCPAWVARVSDGDPDPTVRRIAAYFRKVALQTPVEVRPAGGP
jgi:HEAT repeat protein